MKDELEKVRKRMEELEKESAAFCSTSIDTSTRANEHFDDFVPEFALHVGDLQEISRKGKFECTSERQQRREGTSHV